MKPFRLTLNNRIITLLVIFSVLLISSFTFIQLRNQLSNITLFNIYRAKLGPVIVKTLLQNAVSQATPEDVQKMLQATLDALSDKKVVDKSFVFNSNGIILSSTDPDAKISADISSQDVIRTNQLIKSGKSDTSYINTTERTVDIYLLISSGYIAKITFSLGNIQEALNQVYNPVILTGILIMVASILFGVALSKTVIGPISVLNEATKDIAAGNLDLRVKINTKDELEELSETFNDMTAALKRMKAIAENANPLTHLPGNNVIREEAEKRLKENKKFVVIHSDLDNFKAYNDKYGLMKGDEAILLTCQILQDALRNKGNADDFVGHEGGDDFVAITTPDKDESVTDHIIKEFDKKIRALYNQEDLNRGHIIAKGRDGIVHEFPIMTISLSGVSNATRKIESYAEITNIAAEIKKKVKAIERSVYLLDRRTSDERPSEAAHA